MEVPMARKTKTRGSYPTDLKRKAVQLASQEGVTVTEVADQLGVPPQQISIWKAKFKDEGEMQEARMRLDALDENRQLRDEIRRLKMENDILKKAASFFASQK
jgi:transposase